MKLFVVTDLANCKWLTYLLEEFQRIQKATFQIKVVVEQPDDSEPVMFYTKKNPGNENWIQIKKATPGKRIEWQGIQIIDQSQGNGTLIPIDIFWNAFVLLSRLEEWDAESNGMYINSYSTRHPHVHEIDFKKPVVNILFEILQKTLEKHYPVLHFSSEVFLPKIEWSHDLDYIQKTLQLRLKQTAFNIYNSIRSISKPEKFLLNLRKTIKFGFSKQDYWLFDYWTELEKKHNIRSVFYIYCNFRRSFSSWLLDPSYSIKNNNQLRQQLKKMQTEGFEIGLHGSFHSARNPELIRHEKEMLESLLDKPVKRVRQHWLRYREEITPGIHEDLFEFDSTIGWNDQMGFRAGIASKYRPYDHRNEKAFKYYIVPQILMDSQLFDYSGNFHNAWKKATEMLNQLEGLSSIHVAVSWHPRTAAEDYNWHSAYEKLLDKYAHYQ